MILKRPAENRRSFNVQRFRHTDIGVNFEENTSLSALHK